jgi:hypothetical protein
MGYILYKNYIHQVEKTQKEQKIYKFWHSKYKNGSEIDTENVDVGQLFNQQLEKAVIYRSR